MVRAVWSGVISFGLVSVPVGLFTATEEREPSFHQFAEGTNDRIRYKRVNERTGDEVDYSDIVKGVDVGGGKYVMITDEELDQIAPRSLSRAGDLWLRRRGRDRPDLLQQGLLPRAGRCGEQEDLCAAA
jgi:Ku protein